MASTRVHVVQGRFHTRGEFSTVLYCSNVFYRNSSTPSTNSSGGERYVTEIEKWSTDMLFWLSNASSNIARWYEIPETQPAYMNPDLQYPEALQGLLGHLFNCCGSEIHERFPKLQQQETITQRCLLQSLLGIAVTMWCFEPTLKSKNYFKDLKSKRIDSFMDKGKFSSHTSNVN